MASVRFDALKNYKIGSQIGSEVESNEQMFVRSLYCCVLSYCILSIKGGWQHVEETVNFLLMQREHVCFLLNLTDQAINDLIVTADKIASGYFLLCRVAFHISPFFVIFSRIYFRGL